MPPNGNGHGRPGLGAIGRLSFHYLSQAHWRNIQICPGRRNLRRGWEAKFVYKVVSGAVRSHKLLSDGRRQIGAFHLPGDVFGLESGSAHRLTAEAVVDTQTLIFDRSAVEYFAL